MNERGKIAAATERRRPASCIWARRKTIGLEKALTNAFCAHVIETDMVPRFRTGDFAGGIEGAITSL
ncbi:MAG: TPM domain-containing protein, partial [Novosphingobium sp.]